MASLKKVKVKPVHTTLYANLRLLMSIYSNSHSATLENLLTEDVFVLPNSNKKASNEVLYFILKIWSKEKCLEKFKFCWPVLDKKQESQFQRAACSLMQEIKAAHPEASLPTVSLALLLQPGGDKYCNFLLRLTTFLLSQSLKADDLKIRPSVKSEDGLESVKLDMTNDIKVLFDNAAMDHANAEATFLKSEEFSRKLKEWWQSWEDCEETALQRFQKETHLLNVPNELKERLNNCPNNIREFRGVVVDLKNEIDLLLSRLEGSQNGAHQRVSSASPERKATSNQAIDLDGLLHVKSILLKGLSELNLLLDLADQQPGWPMHSEVANLKVLLENGKPADFVHQLEAKLSSANKRCSQAEKRKSIAASKAIQMDPSKLRQIPPTPFTVLNGVKVTPFRAKIGSMAEDEESLESLLSRWNHLPNDQPIPEDRQPPVETHSPTLPSKLKPHVKIQPISPIQKYQPEDKKTLPPMDLGYESLRLTPPNVSEMSTRIQKRKSYFELSGEDLPLGDVSLLELAEMHLSLNSGPSSPEPPPAVPRLPSPQISPEEPEDVKPDLSSLMKRLQAIKERSKHLPSVLIKSELVSP